MKVLILPVTAIALFLFSSCGSYQVQCGNRPLIMYFKGFQPADLDTLILKKYTVNTNFTQRIDSARVIFGYGGDYVFQHDTTIVRVRTELVAGYDWQVFVPALNKTISITEIKSEQRSVKCGRGIFSMDKVGCYCWNPVYSFKKDGLTVTISNPDSEPVLLIQ